MMTQEESMMHKTGQKAFISSRDKELNMSPIVEEKIKNIEDEFEDKEFDMDNSPGVSPKQIEIELIEKPVVSPDASSKMSALMKGQGLMTGITEVSDAREQT